VGQFGLEASLPRMSLGRKNTLLLELYPDSGALKKIESEITAGDPKQIEAAGAAVAPLLAQDPEASALDRMNAQNARLEATLTQKDLIMKLLMLGMEDKTPDGETDDD